MTADTHIQLPFTTSHAFIVGINAYQYLTPLSTAVNDAQVVAQRLSDQHGFTVHPPLLDATHEELRKLLTEDIPKLVEEDDRVLFYFAGHGIALDGEEGPNGYLVAANTRPGQEETLIPMAALHDSLTTLPCRHGLLILDCCFSGAFKWSSGFRDVIFDLPKVIYEERFWRYCKDPAWQVITSAAHDQKAVDIITNQSLGMRREEGGQHSPFAASLLRALNGEGDTVPADKGDGVITATELYTYLRDTVENETTENAKRQSPSMFNLQRHNKGEFIFLNPNHRFNLPPTPDRNPFLGLASYNENDAGLFYGRDRVIEALHHKVSDHSLVVVSGASGTGKSSVIKAGILPQLRKQGYTVLSTIRPGKEPLQTIATELPGVEQKMAEGPVVLVIDQYEELITQCLKEEDRLAFELQIANWLTKYSKLRILLSIRSDFEPQFESEILAPWWRVGRYVVPVFSLEEIREVITKPAAQAVLFYEPEDLVEQLSEEVSQAPGALPLLSFTLSELYHAYLKSGREDRALKEEDYLQLGGVVGALRTRADSIYNNFDGAHQTSMRNLMLRMVSLEGGELASRRVLKSDLVFSDDTETKRLQIVAQTLVEARLIFTGLDSEGKTYYEPAHDALVRAWARLWEWIKLQGEGKLGLMYKLSLAVQDYEEHLIADYLWNDDPRLDFLLADLQNQSLSFNTQEEAFLQKSKALQQRNKRRRWAWIVAVMIGLASLAVYAFAQARIATQQTKEAERSNQAAQDSAKVAQQQRMWALLQADTARLERDNANMQTTLAQQAQYRAEQSARKAQSTALAAQSREIVARNPTFALNLALAAYQRLPTTESRSILSDILNNQEIAFFLETFVGHKEEITSAVFSPDGQTILTGSKDNTAKLWSLNGDELLSLTNDDGPISAVVFSPDGQTILTGSDFGTAKLWSLNGGELISSIGHDTGIEVVAFSPDGQTIFTVGVDRKGKLWDATGNELRTFSPYSDQISSAAFSPDGQTILTSSSDNTAQLWSLTGQVLQTFVGHNGAVFCAAFSPDGQTILTGSEDNTAKLWSLTGEELQTFTGHKRAVSAVNFSSDGNTVLTGSWDGAAKSWSLTGRELRTFAGHSSMVTSVAFSPDNQIVLTGSWDKTAKLWPVLHNELQTFTGHEDAVVDIAFSPNGQAILTGSWDGTAKLWSLEGRLLQTFTGHEGTVTGVAFSSNGQTLLTGSDDGTTKLWSLTGEELLAFTGHEEAVTSVAFSPNGQTILTGSWDNQAKLWSLTGKLLQTFTGHEEAVINVMFSPNGQTILTCSNDGTVKLWPLRGGKPQTIYDHEATFTSAAFSPNGQTILTGSTQGVVKVWSLAGKELSAFTTREYAMITSVAFSPDGQTVLVGSNDETTQLWTLTGHELYTFGGNGRHSLYGAAFSPNGHFILAGNRNGTAKLWRNIYGENSSGALWNRVQKLTAEEQKQYSINWEY